MDANTNYADKVLLKVAHVKRLDLGQRTTYTLQFSASALEHTLIYGIETLTNTSGYAQLSSDGLLDLRFEDVDDMGEVTDIAAKYFMAVSQGQCVVAKWYLGPVVVHTKLLKSYTDVSRVGIPWKWLKSTSDKVKAIA